VTGTVTLAGGTGNDSIEFDDRLDISGIPTTTYTLDNLTLSRGSITFTYGSFESQTLRAADGFTPSFRRRRDQHQRHLVVPEQHHDHRARHAPVERQRHDREPGEHQRHAHGAV
jgi:hypothetical protein